MRRRGSPLRVHALPRDPAGTLKPAMLPEAVTGRGVRVSGRSRVRHAARTPGGGSLHSPAASASRILSTAGGQSRNSARARPSLCSRKPLQCQPRSAEKRTQATRKRHASDTQARAQGGGAQPWISASSSASARSVCRPHKSARYGGSCEGKAGALQRSGGDLCATSVRDLRQLLLERLRHWRHLPALLCAPAAFQARRCCAPRHVARFDAKTRNRALLPQRWNTRRGAARTPPALRWGAESLPAFTSGPVAPAPASPSALRTRKKKGSMTPQSVVPDGWPCAGGGTVPGAVLRKRLGFTQSLSCGSCQAPSILRASARGEAP